MVEEKMNWGETTYIFTVIMAFFVIIGFALAPLSCGITQSHTQFCNFFYQNLWISAGCGIITIASLIFLGIGDKE